jgi:hypothetical protein
MKVRISWIERTLKEEIVEVNSIEEAHDTEIILGEGDEQWIELEDNSITHEEVQE